uniref:Uncharacterized protein n=1 Tax=Rhizophora mucronata TaxID=61149 RepID=A0A2P2IX27_RHIMU
MSPHFCSISSHVFISKASLKMCSVTLPMPPILRIGSEEINVIMAIRSFGKTNCPLGFLIS